MSNTAEDGCEGSVATDSAAATDSPAFTEDHTETDAFIKSSLGSLGKYKMDNKRRGYALIFNHEHFSRSGLRKREGTNVDRDNLEKRLKKLSFKVETHNDLKQKDVLEKICKAAGKDHSDADCFLLVFMSHGEKGHVWANDGKISIQEDITSKFKGDKCSSLVGKPKIFIFQFAEILTLVNSEVSTRSRRSTNIEANGKKQIPCFASMLTKKLYFKQKK